MEILIRLEAITCRGDGGGLHLARLIKIPQALVIVADFQLALLAAMVYTGYDFSGYQELGFPNLTEGVAQMIREHLGS
jgi:hypothetical protein